MKKHLDELTVNQFVSLVSGDISVLGKAHEIFSEKEAHLAMRNIIFEYKEITDPSGMKGYIMNAEDLIKANCSVKVFTMCDNLVSLGEYKRVAEILEVAGIVCRQMSDKRLAAEVKSRLNRAKKRAAEIEDNIAGDKDANPQELRKLFDEQTATLIAHYKFQIDTGSMKASIYAHLIARLNREVKAMLANKKK